MNEEERPPVNRYKPEPRGIPYFVEKMGNGDTIQIVCYGNSITYGLIVGDPSPQWEPYPQKLQSLLRARYRNENIEVLNRGMPGLTAEMGYNSVDTAVIAKKPEICVLMLGINDCLNGVDRADFSAKLYSLVKKIRKAGIQVFLLTPTPINREEYMLLQKFRYDVVEVAQRTGVGFLDMNALIHDRRQTENLSWDQILPDGVHFAQDKYVWIAEEIDAYWASFTP